MVEGEMPSSASLIATCSRQETWVIKARELVLVFTSNNSLESMPCTYLTWVT